MCHSSTRRLGAAPAAWAPPPAASCFRRAGRSASRSDSAASMLTTKVASRRGRMTPSWPRRPRGRCRARRWRRRRAPCARRPCRGRRRAGVPDGCVTSTRSSPSRSAISWCWPTSQRRLRLAHRRARQVARRLLHQRQEGGLDGQVGPVAIDGRRPQEHAPLAVARLDQRRRAVGEVQQHLALRLGRRAEQRVAGEARRLERLGGVLLAERRQQRMVAIDAPEALAGAAGLALAVVAIGGGGADGAHAPAAAAAGGRRARRRRRRRRRCRRAR